MYLPEHSGQEILNEEHLGRAEHYNRPAESVKNREASREGANQQSEVLDTKEVHSPGSGEWMPHKQTVVWERSNPV